MNKDLKFRIWDKKNNRFLDQNERRGLILLDLSGNVRIAEWACGNGDNSANSVFEAAEDQDRYIIQRYTGLQDQEGKNIFEGDIIKVHRTVKLKTYEKNDYYRKGVFTYSEEKAQTVYKSVIFGEFVVGDFDATIIGWGLSDEDFISPLNGECKLYQELVDTPDWQEVKKEFVVVGNVCENAELLK